MPDSASAPSARPAPIGDASFVRIDAVSRVYPLGRERVTALRNVSLRLPADGVTGIVGRSGSGKSTLLHLLAAMDRPSSGEIAVGSWRLARLDRRAQARYRREMVGMVFQQFNLVPSMTALENVMLPLVMAGMARDVRRARAADCLARVGLEARMRHRPGELSGGEQQRVAIARALAADPPLLLADEPTGNLDSVTGREIVDLLARLVAEEGKTLVVVTHHPDEIDAVADRFIELHDGRVADGPAG